MQLRGDLLALHKVLLESERTSYEIVRGPIASPAAFLQLLINDPWFAWLRPITTQVVQIDEALAAKKPPAEPATLDRLFRDTHALMSPSRGDENGFWQRYSKVIDRDPGVAQLHAELVKLFG